MTKKIHKMFVESKHGSDNEFFQVKYMFPAKYKHLRGKPRKAQKSTITSYMKKKRKRKKKKERRNAK